MSKACCQHTNQRVRGTVVSSSCRTGGSKAAPGYLPAPALLEPTTNKTPASSNKYTPASSNAAVTGHAQQLRCTMGQTQLDAGPGKVHPPTVPAETEPTGRQMSGQHSPPTKADSLLQAFYLRLCCSCCAQVTHCTGDMQRHASQLEDRCTY
jgi:hypothetical protein